MRRRAVYTACLLLAVAACSDAPPTAAPGNNQQATSEATAARGEDRSAAPLDKAALVLSGEGIVIDAREIKFGENAPAGLAALAGVYGKPSNIETLEECGAGPLQVASFKDLTITLQDEKFVGWALDGRDRQDLPKTAAGIGIGSARQALDRAYRTQVFDSSLGTEFTADGLNGLLTGEEPTATVTHLWAGTNCIMR